MMAPYLLRLLCLSLSVFFVIHFTAGLLVMVFGSYYMWYRLKKSHTLGFAVLAAGFASCAMFFASFLR